MKGNSKKHKEANHQQNRTPEVDNGVRQICLRLRAFVFSGGGFSIKIQCLKICIKITSFWYLIDSAVFCYGSWTQHNRRQWKRWSKTPKNFLQISATLLDSPHKTTWPLKILLQFAPSCLLKTPQWLGLDSHEVEGSNPNNPPLVALNLGQYPPRYGKKTIKINIKSIKGQTIG